MSDDEQRGYDGEPYLGGDHIAYRHGQIRREVHDSTMDMMKSPPIDFTNYRFDTATPEEKAAFWNLVAKIVALTAGGAWLAFMVPSMYSMIAGHLEESAYKHETETAKALYTREIQPIIDRTGPKTVGQKELDLLSSFRNQSACHMRTVDAVLDGRGTGREDCSGYKEHVSGIAIGRGVLVFESKEHALSNGNIVTIKTTSSFAPLGHGCITVKTGIHVSGSVRVNGKDIEVDTDQLVSRHGTACRNGYAFRLVP